MTDTAPLTPAEIARLLRSSTDALVAETRALGARATVEPAPGEWCANEVLGHLIEADRRGFGGRIRAVLAEDRPTFVSWDQPGVAAARRDAERNPVELITELLAQRAVDLAFVAALDPSLVGRVGIHPSVGELSISDLLHEWVHHDREHLMQMVAVTQAIVRPSMGNARKFSEPQA